jgi:hypothetical protein
MRASLKIKNFLWYLRKGIILTKKIILLNKIGKTSKQCCFCQRVEIINHLFFTIIFLEQHEQSYMAH